MGFFGAYAFDGSTWHSFDPDSDQVPDFAGRWLSVHIHDSDFAIVRYQPAGPGSGTAYLGCTPRMYFEDESASAPTDVLHEAEGLASRLAQQQGMSDTTELRELVASFLADDADVADDTGDLDDEDIFVEVKVSKFLTAVSLPVPAELPGA